MIAHLLLPVLSLPQAFGGSPVDEVRLRAAWSERAEEFFRAWSGASEERRAATAQALDELRDPSAPLDRRPSLLELHLLTRVLGGEKLLETRAEDLARFVAALDLRSEPGFFFSQSEDPLGQSLRILAVQLFPAELEGPGELSLYWQAPDGSEQRARTEPFPAAAFSREVPLFLRAPRGPAGEWRLVAEFAWKGRAERGHALSVECVAGSEERWSAADREGNTPLGRLWRGARGPLLEGPVAAHFDSGSPPSAARAEVALLFLTPELEDPSFVLRPSMRARWRTLEQEHGVVLGSVLVPLGSVGRLPDAIGSWRERARRVVLVARGDAAYQLAWIAKQQALSVDGWVLCAALDRPPQALGEVPTLLVHTRAWSAAQAPLVRHVDGGSSAFLAEPRLPILVDEWLDTLGWGGR